MKRTVQTHKGNVTGSGHNKRARYSQTPVAAIPRNMPSSRGGGMMSRMWRAFRRQ